MDWLKRWLKHRRELRHRKWIRENHIVYLPRCDGRSSIELFNRIVKGQANARSGH